ncbi:MAG: thioredoxin domain-containing protein [Deltaproteobacteria bacterium]|nr:thioredoxin domain-containing protein [Deltaproteobacteria bacterium]
MTLNCQTYGNQNQTAFPGWPMWFVLLFCLLGIFVSVKLTQIHVSVHTDPEYHSICAVSEGVNCETVAFSPYSVFWGLPVSVWGIVGYIVMGFFAAWALHSKRLHSTFGMGILFLLATFSVAASAALAYISHTRIDSLCLFCMASYAINLLLLATTLVGWRKIHVPVGQLIGDDLHALFLRPVLFFGLVTAAIGILGVLFVFMPTYWHTPGWSEIPPLKSGTENGHNWIGATNPMVTVVEFSDYECPYCRTAHKNVRLWVARFPKKIRLVHRHLPLDMACHPELHRPFHKRACEFAKAAECAALQGMFWEMNDALFSIQKSINTKDVNPMEIAVRLGLNRSEFKKCLETDGVTKRIRADVEESMKQKLSGTPTFIINNKKFMGKIPEEEFEKMLHSPMAHR